MNKLPVNVQKMPPKVLFSVETLQCWNFYKCNSKVHGMAKATGFLLQQIPGSTAVFQIPQFSTGTVKMDCCSDTPYGQAVMSFSVQRNAYT